MTDFRDDSASLNQYARPWLWPMGPALLMALAAIGVFFWITSQRAFYPFELEWMEGGSLQHLSRIVAGQPVYPPPSIEFAAYPYPPLYYYAAVPVASLTGVNFLSLRLVSLLATVATAAILCALVRHETRRWDLGLITAGLFVATYQVSGAYMDVGRIDPLFVALVAGTVYALRVAKNRRGLLLAAALASLSIMTKQTGLVLLGPIFLWCLYRDWMEVESAAGRYRRTLWFSGATLGLVLLATLVFSRGGNSHFFFSVFGAHRGHPIRWSMLPQFFLDEFFFALPLAVLTLSIWIWREEDRQRVLFYLALLTGTLVACLVPRIKVGGALNNLILLHAFVVLLLGIALGTLLEQERRRRWASPVAALCLVAQFAWLAFDPRDPLPGPGDAEAGNRIVGSLSEVEGEILMPAFGYLAERAGKRTYAHEIPLRDLVMSNHADAHSLTQEYRDAIATRRFSMIIDSKSRFLEGYAGAAVLTEHYRPAGQLDSGEDFVPPSGWPVKMGLVWVPRDEVQPASERSAN